MNSIPYSHSLLQLDLIIRDKNLNVANPSDTSTHDLLHSLMRIEKKSLHEVRNFYSNIDVNKMKKIISRRKNIVHIRIFNWLILNQC